MRKLLSAFLLLLAPLAAVAQVPVALMPIPHAQFLDANAKPLAGGKVCFFNAGTTTPAATYVDVNGVILNSNPVVLDSGGFATIYLANQSYKITVYDSSGNTACPNSGVQQWSQDNVSAYQIVIGPQTIVFASVTSDPVGQLGMVDYRSDLGRLRFFNGSWDSLIGLATTDTLTNKTFDVSANTLKNSANVAGHYLRNNGTQYVDSTIQSSDLSGAVVVVVGSSNLTAQQANIGATTLTTPAVNGFYRFSCYIIITQAATTSSTTPSCGIGWTDADTSAVLAATLLQTNTVNIAGNVSVEASNTLRNVFAKAGTVISFSTSNYASVGATPMQYAIHVRLEGPF